MTTYFVTVLLNDRHVIEVEAESIQGAEQKALRGEGMIVDKAGETYEKVLSSQEEVTRG